MKRTRAWSVLPCAAVLIAVGCAAALAKEDEPGESRWPIKTTVPAAADLDRPRNVP